VPRTRPGGNGPRTVTAVGHTAVAGAGIRGRCAQLMRRAGRWRWRGDREVTLGIAVVGVLVVACLLAPVFAPDAPNRIDILNALKGPSFSHPLGTDYVGRDVLSRMLYGARTDLALVTIVTYAGLFVGVTLGTAAAYFGGWRDAVVGRLADATIAFPFIVLVLAVVAVTGPGLTGVGVGILLQGWALYARLARTEMLTLREQPFMMATKALGYSNMRALFRHAYPNIIRSSLVYSTVDVVVNLLVIAAVSYLGLGQQDPSPDLGSLIASGQPYLRNAWWIATLPGIFLVVFGFGISLIGDGLSEGELKVGTR
jgi:peptide/nickel transport system permease protein